MKLLKKWLGGFILRNRMGNLADYYSRDIEIVSGDGCYLFDQNGKKYLDFLAGWCVGNVGWGRKEIKEAVEKQLEKGAYVPPVFRSRLWEEFAELLIKISPNKNLTRAFRCTSGSEAVEFAIKCARAATGKHKIISAEGTYHGHTYGAAAVGNACTKAMAPCASGFEKIPQPDAYRGVTGSQVLEKMESILRNDKDIAAFLSEPVWSNAGVFVPPEGFYKKVEELCRQYGVLLIMDEVATGFGRCGKLFGYELWDIKPDIVCLGKGLTGGYSTMGATLVTEDIYKASFDIPFYSTFGWNVFDLAAAKANVEIILRDRLWENSQSVGGHLLNKLKSFEEKSFIGEARGVGLLLGIDIVQNKKSKARDGKKADEIMNQCAENGLLLETAHNVLFVTPPLILTKEQADEGAEILASVLK